MNRTIKIIAGLLLLLAPAPVALAQGPTPIVVSSCGSQSLTATQNANPTVDTTGKLCTSGGGGGSTNATIVGPLGTQTAAASVATTVNGTVTTAGTVSNFPTTSGTPCATATTAGCTIPDITAYLAQVAANPITVGPTASPTALIQATKSAAVSTSSAATLQVIAASGSTVIYVTHWELVTTLANNVTWESGDTGGSCANPVALSGAMPFAANGGASAGSGTGPILILPAGKALCMLTSAATQISGSVAAAQF